MVIMQVNKKLHYETKDVFTGRQLERCYVPVILSHIGHYKLYFMVIESYV